MKRLLTLSWLLCLTVGIVNAHILSKPEYSKHPSRAPINIDVSLMDRYSRTYTEQQLLDQYVAVFKSAWAKNLLFVVDDQDRVALFDKDGNQLLPFLEGKPRVLFGYGNFVVLGDQSTNDEWEAFFDEIRASYATTRRMTVGNCAAVYSIDAKKVLMNDGEFDYITCTFKYPKIYFYVARYNENDSLKWGLYSTKKVLLPCEYNYVTHTPKPKGDNSKDMWEEQLRKTGFYLGKFIYLMDAWDDREEDQKRGNYNIFNVLGTEEDTALAMMQDTMAHCCRAFEQLPIVEMAPILRNILYAGVWTAFASGQERSGVPDRSL